MDHFTESQIFYRGVDAGKALCAAGPWQYPPGGETMIIVLQKYRHGMALTDQTYLGVCLHEFVFMHWDSKNGAWEITREDGIKIAVGPEDISHIAELRLPEAKP